jgi:hypothetical protein
VSAPLHWQVTALTNELTSASQGQGALAPGADRAVIGTTFLVYIMEFVGVAIYATRIQNAFVYDSTYVTDVLGASHHLDLAAMRDTMAVMSTSFADCILIWAVTILR